MNMKVENPSLSVILFGCFSGLLFIVIYVALMFLLRALLVYYYFDWFITPVTEWQLQSFVHALGFSAAWMYMVNGLKIDDGISKQFEDKSDTEKTKIAATFIIKQLSYYASAFLFGYIFHSLM